MRHIFVLRTVIELPLVDDLFAGVKINLVVLLDLSKPILAVTQ